MKRFNHYASPRIIAPTLAKTTGLLPLVDLAELPGGGRRIVDRHSSSYVIPDGTGKYVAIDGGWDRSAGRIEWFIKRQGLELKDCLGIFVTHCHIDHEGLLAALADNKSTKIFISQAENEVFQGRAPVEGSISKLLERLPGWPSVAMPGVETEVISHGDQFKFGNLTLKAMAMPGHTAGSLGFLVNQELDDSRVLYAGDSLVFTKREDVRIAPKLVNGDNQTSWQTVSSLGRRLLLDSGTNVEIVPAHSGNSGVNTLLTALEFDPVNL